MQILTRNYVEGGSSLNVGVGGKWKASVVNASTGAEYFPFGDVFRPNLILNQGLRMLVSTPTDNFFYTPWSYLVYVAYIRAGGDGTAPAVTQTGLQGTQITGSWENTPGTVPFGVDSTTEGSRTMYKSIDFPLATATQTIREFAVKLSSNANGDNFAGTGLQTYSRFVTPDNTPIVVNVGQFLRVVYALKFVCPDIVSPVSVSATAGSFVLDGSLQQVGTYDRIFGRISGDPGWDYTASLNLRSRPGVYGDWPHSRACLLNSAAVSIQPTPNVQPTMTAAPGSVCLTTATKANVTDFSHTVSYLFPAFNPSADTSVGGILFWCRASNDLLNGYLLKFNTAQTKHANKALAITLQQNFGRV